MTFESHENISDFVKLYDMGYKSFGYKCLKDKTESFEVKENTLKSMQLPNEEDSEKIAETSSLISLEDFTEPEFIENKKSKTKIDKSQKSKH